MNKRFYLIYGFILTAEIICGELNFQIGVWILKPLIVLSLIYVVLKDDPKKHLFFVIALVFSLIGDVLLMLNQPNLFLFGLGSFLITHLFYIYVFVGKTAFSLNAISRFVIFTVGTYFLYLKGNVPSAVEIPVMVYMTVITAMGITLGSVKTEKPTHSLLFYGALTFLVSDFLIAMDRFVSPIPFPAIWIMSTYGIAQLFITKGYLNVFSRKINNVY